METIAFLGSSRGFGRSVVQAWSKSSQAPMRVILVARKEELLQSLAAELARPATIHLVDLTREAEVLSFLEQMQTHGLTRLIYVAGGGCFGPYPERKWKDHQWTLNLNLLTPALILHQLMQKTKFPDLRQVILVGSQVADEGGDPLAASYAAAKAGLRGLVESVQAEQSGLDVRLLRPGYMDTDLLPPQAWPRAQGLAQDPGQLASEFVRWALDPQGSPILTI